MNLRAVNASVLVDHDGAPRALGWFEIDPTPERIAAESAFRSELDCLQFLAEHPIAKLAPQGLVCRRSSRDLTVRVHAHGGHESLVATFTPMTGDQVLVEIAVGSEQWQAFLLGTEDRTGAREIWERIETAVRPS